MNIPASGSEGTPIAISEETILGSQIGSVGSIRLYPTGDPRYVHEAPQLPKRAYETPNCTNCCLIRMKR
jgi:hypothetical protein